MTTIYFVRHAQSDADWAENRTRPLTAQGQEDSKLITDFFRDKTIDRFYSSPFRRSIDTISGAAALFSPGNQKTSNENIIIEERLRERESLPSSNPMEFLRERWADFDFHEEGGESLGMVQTRNIDALMDILDENRDKTLVIGTHGTALCTIIHYFRPDFNCDDFLRIMNWMPYIVQMEFDGYRLENLIECLHIDRPYKKNISLKASSKPSYSEKENRIKTEKPMLAVFYAHIQEAMEQTGKSLEEILPEIRSMGIQAVEFDYEVLRNSETMLQQALQNADLEISSIYRFYDFGCTKIQPTDYDLIDMAVRLGTNQVMAIPGFYHSTDSEEREKEFQSMLEQMKHLTAYGQAHGVQVLMEDFDAENSPFCTLNGLYRLMTEVPGMGCTFDTGNFKLTGQDEVTAFRKLRPFVKHIHLKDRRTEAAMLSDSEKSTSQDSRPSLTALDGTPLYASPVGDGIIQMEQILSMAQKDGYQGYFSIEHFDAPGQLEYMRQSVDWIQNYFNN